MKDQRNYGTSIIESYVETIEQSCRIFSDIRCPIE